MTKSQTKGGGSTLALLLKVILVGWMCNATSASGKSQGLASSTSNKDDEFQPILTCKDGQIKEVLITPEQNREIIKFKKLNSKTKDILRQFDEKGNIQFNFYLENKSEEKLNVYVFPLREITKMEIDKYNKLGSEVLALIDKQYQIFDHNEGTIVINKLNYLMKELQSEIISRLGSFKKVEEEEKMKIKRYKKLDSEIKDMFSEFDRSDGVRLVFHSEDEKGAVNAEFITLRELTEAEKNKFDTLEVQLSNSLKEQEKILALNTNGMLRDEVSDLVDEKASYIRSRLESHSSKVRRERKKEKIDGEIERGIR